MALVVDTLHAEGINMRFLGHVRSKIKVHSHQQNHGAIRRLLLHEMVARVLKASVYKILREANGFGGNDGLLVALKDQLGVGSDNRPLQVSTHTHERTHMNTHTCTHTHTHANACGLRR